jgi:hypothetical protein
VCVWGGGERLISAVIVAMMCPWSRARLASPGMQGKSRIAPVAVVSSRKVSGLHQLRPVRPRLRRGGCVVLAHLLGLSMLTSGWQSMKWSGPCPGHFSWALLTSLLGSTSLPTQPLSFLPADRFKTWWQPCEQRTPNRGCCWSVMLLVFRRSRCACKGSE